LPASGRPTELLTVLPHDRGCRLQLNADATTVIDIGALGTYSSDDVFGRRRPQGPDSSRQKHSPPARFTDFRRPCIDPRKRSWAGRRAAEAIVISICIGGTTINPAKLLAALAALGLWACPVGARTCAPASHIGETATVCGVVASAKFEANVPSRPTYWISGSRIRMRFLPRLYMEIIGPSSALPKLRSGGKRICVTGQISDYRGKPEIVLTDPSQLAQ
jgi:hypothetical protein